MLYDIELENDDEKEHERFEIHMFQQYVVFQVFRTKLYKVLYFKLFYYIVFIFGYYLISKNIKTNVIKKILINIADIKKWKMTLIQLFLVTFGINTVLVHIIMYRHTF